MNRLTTALTIIGIAVSVIAIIQADLSMPDDKEGYRQNTSTLGTTNIISSSIANATSYGGGTAIAHSGSATSEASATTSSVTDDQIQPIRPSPIALNIAKNEQPIPAIKYARAHLIISATGADVTIKEGDPKLPYSGGSVSSTGAEQVVFLPKGQPLTVSLSGTGADLTLSRLIAKQVTVNKSGVGAYVSVF